jgi:hypothetical protein
MNASEKDASGSGGEPAPQSRKPVKAVVWAEKLVRFILSQWLLIGFGTACVLGYFFPGMLIPFNLSNDREKVADECL